MNIPIVLLTALLAMATLAVPMVSEGTDAAEEQWISTDESGMTAVYTGGTVLEIILDQNPGAQMTVRVDDIAYGAYDSAHFRIGLSAALSQDSSHLVVVTASGYSAHCTLVYGVAYDVTFKAGTGGSVDDTSTYTVLTGTTFSATGTVMTLGDADNPIAEVTATASSGYTFKAWSPSSGTVTKNMTLTATFSGSGPGPGPGPTPTTYTVTFAVDPTVGGTVSKTSVSGLSSGTAISASGSTVTIGSGTTAQTITATAASGYSFKEWSGIPTSGTVTANITVTAVFTESAQPVTKEVDNGSVTIPASVVESAGIKDASKLILKIDKVTPTASNIPSDAICYQVTLTYDGKALTKFSDYIDVLLKLPTGILSTGLKVYYVSDDGTTVENMNATYDAGTNSMFFKTKHLSVFAITKENIEPVPVLSSISVKTAPSKVSYTVGDKFDPTGLVLTLTYSDSSTATLEYKGHESDFSFSPSTSTALKVTDKTVTITYEGKSTSQAISVSESPSGGDDNTMMIVIIVIVVILLIAAIAFFVMKKRI